MKKFLAVLLSVLAVVSVLSSCTKELPDEKLPAPEAPALKVAETTRVVALKGPTGMGMAKLITDADEKYSFELTSMPDDVTSALLSKTVDIAAVPVNLASVLYNKTNGGVKVIALNTLGVLHIVNSDGTVADLEDLKGKTLGATGQASTPEYILRYILKENGIDPEKDLTINFYTDHAELATHMISGEVTVGMLPEPQVSTVIMKNDACKSVIDLSDEWMKISPDSALVQGCIVARTEFIEEYPDSVKAFLDEYKASVEYALNDEKAPETIAALGIVANAEIAKRALPGANICYIDSNGGMKEKLSGTLDVLYNANAKSVGGALPKDDFYYENK
jgi:NitT/TauT family transport system substrate-binding protein